MNPFVILAQHFITYPIYAILVVFLAITGGNLWLSIIWLTLAIRWLMFPVTSAGNNVSKHMTDIQPKLQEIQEKYKDNPEKLSEETMKLMKDGWLAPLKWCLGLLIQLPVFIAMYRIIISIADNWWTVKLSNIYSFLQPLAHSIQTIKTHFLGMDLLSTGSTANIILAVICGLLMFAQFSLMKVVNPQQTKANAQKLPNGQEMPDMSGMMWIMNYFMAIAMASFVYNMQIWVGIYIFTTTIFGVLQMCWQYRVLLWVKLKALFAK